MGLNGVAGTRKSNTSFCRRYTSNGGDPAIRFRSAVDSIPAWHQRLRTVQIYQGDGIELCKRVEDKAGTVIYCDPPYVEKGSAYLHDFESEDHDRLAETLRRFEKTRVVVSYYEHPRVREMYPESHWQWIPLSLTKALVSSARRDTEGEVVKAPEVLLVNRVGGFRDVADMFGEPTP